MCCLYHVPLYGLIVLSAFTLWHNHYPKHFSSCKTETLSRLSDHSPSPPPIADPPLYFLSL